MCLNQAHNREEFDDELKNETKEQFEFGVYSFGELLPVPLSGKTTSPKQRIQDIIAAAKIADEAGLDIFGVGEHHRLDFAFSSYRVILAAIAQATKNIRLISTPTVLGTDDPVRIFEDFATLDLLSGGHAEIIAGRGAFSESFPLCHLERPIPTSLFNRRKH